MKQINGISPWLWFFIIFILFFHYGQVYINVRVFAIFVLFYRPVTLYSVESSLFVGSQLYEAFEGNP